MGKHRACQPQSEECSQQGERGGRLLTKIKAGNGTSRIAGEGINFIQLKELYIKVIQRGRREKKVLPSRIRDDVNQLMLICLGREKKKEAEKTSVET